MGKNKNGSGRGFNSRHRGERKSRLEIGANDIHPFSPLKNGHGKYIPFCSFPGHVGILGTVKVKACERKRCDYLRYYKEGFPTYIDQTKLNN